MRTETFSYQPGKQIPVPNGGKIIGITPMQDDSYQVTVQLPEPIDPSVFVKVEASKLSLNDQIFDEIQIGDLNDVSPWHRIPYGIEYRNAERCRRLYDTLEYLIPRGLRDFYRPKYDPSMDEFGNLVFEPGKMPEVGHTYAWWENAAKNFMPERNSRLGTQDEYYVFLGVLIKKLVESGMSVYQAWHSVCYDSSELVSQNSTHNGIEKTGYLGEVCGFSDLANVRKMFAVTDEHLWTTGCCYKHSGRIYPLASFIEIGEQKNFNQYHDHPGDPFYDNPDEFFFYITGWIILPT